MLRNCRATWCVAVGLLAHAGCGGSDNPNSPAASSTLRGSVTDASGDSLFNALIAVSPDLVSGTVEVAGGNLTLTISFAPGTLSQAQTYFEALFDTDENSSTGGGTQDGLPGTDYLVHAANSRGSTQATIYRCPTGAACTETVGTAGITFPSANQARVTVPLTLLGNDDGRLKFKVFCEQWLSEATKTAALDWMPDRGAEPGLVR